MGRRNKFNEITYLRLDNSFRHQNWTFKGVNYNINLVSLQRKNPLQIKFSESSLSKYKNGLPSFKHSWMSFISNDKYSSFFRSTTKRTVQKPKYPTRQVLQTISHPFRDNVKDLFYACKRNPFFTAALPRIISINLISTIMWFLL